ncbi:hypothetical protein OG21DRAFT_636842 [Imleria badia]|nr:hypothetical protein OG21DRAFT_636842 [Imleria badia]
MTYPGFPFPHALYHVQLHRPVRIADDDGHEKRRSFDRLVVASGHSHYPHSPTFPGQDAWLRRRNGGGRREIIHSMFYREPQQYANQMVVVVGLRASGRDAVSQLALYARKGYHSLRSQNDPAHGPVEIKPEIAYFTPDAIAFADSDGSRAHGVDAVILGTGYDLRIPFLIATGELAVDPNLNAHHHSDDKLRLTTNLRHLFPLHQHLFFLSTSRLVIFTFTAISDWIGLLVKTLFVSI